jgi:hypothetical protein
MQVREITMGTGLTQFQKRLARLDTFLTGRKWKDVEHNARNQRFTVEKLLGVSAEYYLSDGGYSRIALDQSTGHIFLTSNSLEKPRRNWDHAKKLIADIEHDINATISEYWEDTP